MGFTDRIYKFSYNFIFLSIIIFISNSTSYSQDTVRSPYEYSFKELSEINVITGTLKKENILTSPSNVIIITKKMIEERNYQTLVDVCQDIPGFDFMTYNDGGGEYPTYNMNRGVGSIGNSKILVMLDGVVQNNISFNWSLLWTYENMLIDVERIEIIQGPGSVMYGAQAFSGIIHIITKKEFSGIKAKTFYGSNSTIGVDFFGGKKLKKDINISFALHAYHSNGDMGNRYDPGNYFHNNKYPDTILQDYDANGNYLTNVANPIGGKDIPNGFNTKNDSYAFRIKGNYKKIGINASFWGYEKGGGSHIVAYKYNLTDKSYKSKSQAYHILLKNDSKLNSKLLLNSNVVFRSTNVLPGTGFKYLYRFPNLIKNYASYAYQSYLEEKVYYKIKDNNVFLFGIKGMYSKKNERIVSLGMFPNSENETPSSWDIAQSGNGLFKTKKYNFINVYETAAYLLWDNKWTNTLSSSMGIRHDFSTEFGNVLNPRLSFIYQGINGYGVKILYGKAFRQPSVFELTSEFRGNPNLKPERVTTYEVETNILTFNNKLAIKSNIFYSDMIDFINKVDDKSMPSGEKYENIGIFSVTGASIIGIFKVNENIRFNANYIYMLGKFGGETKWKTIERTAKNKLNLGINSYFFNKTLMLDLRMNYVGKRKAQQTNIWLQTYEDGFAPSYTKFNFNISYKFLKYLNVQFTINNIFNEQYYGIGRETGSGFIDDYDYRYNPNPNGHIPAYHPQPGRTFIINLLLSL